MPRQIARWLGVFLLAPALTFSAKRPLAHKDFDSWRSIASTTLSRDGRWLAYSYMPQDGDGEVVIRNLATSKEFREPVGALPPPPIQNPEEANPDEPPTQRSVRIAFSADGRYAVASTYPSKADVDKAVAEKKKPADMPKQGLLIVNLSDGQTERIASVKNFQIPAKGAAWLAYLKEGVKESTAPDAKEGQPRASRKEYGSDLLLRDLSKPAGNARTYADVADYSLSRDGDVLLYSVSSRKEEDNGVYRVSPASDAAAAALLSGKGKYGRLVWDRGQSQLTFVSTRDDVESKTPAWKLYVWNKGSNAAREVLTASAAGFRSGFVITDKGSLSFSRDGKKLFVPTATPPKPEKEGVPNANQVLADLWHWKDGLIQPMQRIRANRERNRTYTGVLDLARTRYTQLADLTLPSVIPSDNGALAIGLDDRPYRALVAYDGNYTDVYLLDTATGTRKQVLKQHRSGFGEGAGLHWSPDSKYVAYYAGKNWSVVDTTTGAVRDLTSKLGVAFYDELDDTPDPPGAYGTAGWSRDSQSIFAYDRYDVWELYADGRAPRNVTEGDGRKQQTEYRVQRVEEDNPDEPGRGINRSQPLYLRAESEKTRESGFYLTRLDRAGPPRLGVGGAKNYRFVTKAKDADLAVITASRFNEYPDLYTLSTSNPVPVKVSNGGAQLDAFVWGSSELIDFRNTDGVPLQAALYKPEGFDPKKKYPLLIYIYERLSQNVNNFVNPAPGHSINISLYVSNGYVVVTPDIVYKEGYPGPSALQCVLPAVQAVVDRGFIDENAIGIQGHSWGGYQIAYMVTQTSRFKAAEAGAPVGNMTSAYSGIRWGSGLPRQFQYEQTQSRIGKTLTEAPLRYIENSPVFFADRVTTPLLMLHDDQDDAVPWYQGIELYLALRRHEKEVYLFNYNGEFHGLRRRHNQKDFAIRMQQFFDHFLKGAPKPGWMEEGIPFIDREDEKERFLKATDQRAQ